jgi:DNA-directed RNA polymerase subunit RPC12/RpoP
VESFTKAMSEFKFACPICGQHITADSKSTGSQLECPTCFRKIVVPQAPASADSKFILSAAEANKPRPPQSIVPGMEPISKAPARTAVPIALIVLLIALCSAGATLYVFRGKVFKPKAGSGQSAGNSESSNEDGTVADNKAAPVPVITNNVAWSLDLTNAVFPTESAAGKIRGEFVSCNRNTAQSSGSQDGKPVVGLGFRQTMRGLPDLSATIYFSVNQPEQLHGLSINVTTNDTPVPRVTVRWREGANGKSHSFSGGYALKVEFGEVAGNRLPGKIYLCLPDEAQSCVAGTFNAEIKKPTPPKPKPAKPKPAS